MSGYLHLDAQTVKAEIGKLLASYPELTEDDTLRADSIEGETDAAKLIERALSERREAETLAEAVGSRISDLSARKSRLQRKADAMKALIVGVMRAARLNTIILPEASIWATKGRVSVNVLNLDDLPQGYYRVKREADKGAIKSALEQGEEIPGAELVTGEPTLTIRSR
jgi:hypothetical protein